MNTFKQSLMYSCVALIGFSSSLSYADLPPPPDAGESICGNTTDYQDVEMYDGTLGPSTNFVNNNQRMVGQIQWNDDLASKYTNEGNVNDVRWCSGTLIGPNLFLTAGHCFDVKVNDGRGWDFPIDDQTDDEISPRVAATNMHVNFGYQRDGNGRIQNGTQVEIKDMLEYRNGGLDYAILLLEGSPGNTFGIQDLTDATPRDNQRLTIIQHPAGLPKVIDAGNYDGVEASGRLAGYMRYTELDTRGGSSGSGVLTNAGQIIGVHTNAGCTATGGANHGVYMSSIRRYSQIVDQLLSNANLPAVSWSSWSDSDNPDASGDWEGKPSSVCDYPLSIQARVRGSNTLFNQFDDRNEDFYRFNESRGLACRHKDQSGSTKCRDYQVRFLCPQGEWTDWLNRDTPNASGDWESKRSFSSVCANPTDIVARVVGESKVYTTEDINNMPDSMYRFNANSGLACRNGDQRDGRCNDYEVKFLCP